MERFLKKYQFSTREERFLFEAEKLMFLMFELAALLAYLKKNFTKTGVVVAKRYLPMRILELKEGLRNFNF